MAWPSDTQAQPVRCAEPGCGAHCTTQNRSTPFAVRSDESVMQVVLTARMPAGWSTAQAQNPSGSTDPFVPARVTRHWCPEHSPASVGDEDGFPAGIGG
jgi:hypothetical protein